MARTHRRKLLKRLRDTAYHCVFHKSHVHKQFTDCVKRKAFVSELRRHHERHDFFYCTQCFTKVETSQAAKEHLYSGECDLRCITDKCPNRDQLRATHEVKCEHGTPNQRDIWKRLWRLVHGDHIASETFALSPSVLTSPCSPTSKRKSILSTRSTSSPQPTATDTDAPSERTSEVGTHGIKQLTENSFSHISGFLPENSCSETRIYHCVYHDPTHPERDATEFCNRPQQTISALKRHHAHKRHNFFYCTVCFKVLESARDRDDHERTRSCDFRCVEEGCPNYARQIMDLPSPCDHGRQNSQIAIFRALQVLARKGELIPPAEAASFKSEKNAVTKSHIDTKDINMVAGPRGFSTHAGSLNQTIGPPAMSRQLPSGPVVHFGTSYNSLRQSNSNPTEAPHEFAAALPPNETHCSLLPTELAHSRSDSPYPSRIGSERGPEIVGQHQARPTEREANLERLLALTWNAIESGNLDQLDNGSILHRAVSQLISGVGLRGQNPPHQQRLSRWDMYPSAGFDSSEYSGSIYSGFQSSAPGTRPGYPLEQYLSSIPNHDAQVPMLTASNLARTETCSQALSLQEAAQAEQPYAWDLDRYQAWWRNP